MIFGDAGRSPRRIMAHYMPWFSSREVSGNWGWHWTMNHFDPERVSAGGRRDVASRYYPQIGPYDSSDPDALQCQVLLMKLAGIDGVIIDWYGNDEYLDYGINNRNTLRLIPYLRQAGLSFAICYEDQTVPREISAGRFAAANAVKHGQDLIRWMQQNFFTSPVYLKLDGQPVLLSFGAPYYNDAQWNEIFSVLPVKPMYFTENDRRAATASIGGFDWPVPGGGTAGAFREQDAFYDRTKNWPRFIAAAFPRFSDSYAQAGVGKGLGTIEDRDGRTFADTLSRALQSKVSVVQLVTWNDWGEGTQIEPSVEFGYRDLETIQKMRKRYLDASFDAASADLRLPVRWYLLRKKYARDARASKELDAFFPLAASGRMDKARALLARYK